jgi:molecular chaperone DnaK
MKFIGIDLGTTLTEVGCFDDSVDEFQSSVKTLPIRQMEDYRKYIDNTSICSVIFFMDKNEYCVGEYAKKMLPYHHDRVVFNSKLHIGTATTLNCEKTAKECAQLILTECKRAIISELGRSEYKDLSQIIVTVPASFDTFKSQETLEAAKIVFLDKEVKILDEPTAALIYYVFQQNKIIPQNFVSRNKRILIYDIGGGTCDTCIMDVSEDLSHRMNFLVTGRFSEFGGNDFDDKIAQMILFIFLHENRIEVKSIPENELKILLLRLLPYASDIKLEYSKREELLEVLNKELHIPNFYHNMPLYMTINSNMISSSIKTLVDKSYRTSRKNIYCDMDYALSELMRKVHDNNIDMILLTGGASGLPIIREAFLEEYHKPVVLINRPQDAVAIGAAIFSQLNDSSFSSISPLSTGNESDATEFRTGFGSQYLLDVDGMILDTVIDSQVQLPFTTMVEYITNATNGLFINVLFGSSKYDCKLKYIASHSINFSQEYSKVIPKGTPVSLTFELATDRTLKISVKPYNEKMVPLIVDYYYGGSEL